MCEMILAPTDTPLDAWTRELFTWSISCSAPHSGSEIHCQGRDCVDFDIMRELLAHKQDWIGCLELDSRPHRYWTTLCRMHTADFGLIFSLRHSTCKQRDSPRQGCTVLVAALSHFAKHPEKDGTLCKYSPYVLANTRPLKLHAKFVAPTEKKYAVRSGQQKISLIAQEFEVWSRSLCEWKIWQLLT